MDSQCVSPRHEELPTFPWDLLKPAIQRAQEHPLGACDLSVGTPVDPTPDLIQHALAEASNAHGYPTVIGTAEVRDAIRAWCRQRNMVDPGPDGVIPTIGSKEAVAWLPFLLGVRPGHKVLIPSVSYPTYDVGVRLAGATPIPVNPEDVESWPTTATMVWLNSPGNPDGHVLERAQLARIVQWARTHRCLVASDECYAALDWREGGMGTPSALDQEVCQGHPDGIVVAYSLSKQSNMAGYRAALLAGDPHLIQPLVQVRKHSGMMMPAPVQHAMAVALLDTNHVAIQREIYRRRRAVLLDAVTRLGLRQDPHSVAGLYLWLTDPAHPDDSWRLVNWFAELGIIVAPGDFYGQAAHGHVRVALTATDERIEQAVARLDAATLPA